MDDTTYDDSIEETEDEEEDDQPRRNQIIRSNGGMRSRIVVPEAREKRYQAERVSSEPQAKKIDLGTAGLMLIVAIAADALSAAYVGDIFEDLVLTPGFNYWFNKYRQPGTSKNSILYGLGISAVIKLIPGINLIPTWTINVIVFYLRNS